MAVKLNGYVVSNGILDDAGELRERMDREGYLFFRELIDPASTWEVRRDVLGVLERFAWLKEGAPLIDGLANGERVYVEPEPDFLEVYQEVQKLESFHRLAHSQAILDVMEKLIGEEVLPHPAKIARLMFPQNNQHSTPPHQDFVHIQGTTETYTCWMPLGDCPRELGGLNVLPRSHKQGVHDYHLSLGAGGMGVDADYLRGDWLTTDYRAGDALIVHSLTVHESLANSTRDRMRLSADYRYQGVSEPMLDTFLMPHYSTSWDDIYPGWQSTEFQFYWQKQDVKFGERDWSYYDKRDAQALRLAREGDETARPALNRIIVRDTRPEKRQAAKEALRELDAVSAGKQ